MGSGKWRNWGESWESARESTSSFPKCSKLPVFPYLYLQELSLHPWIMALLPSDFLHVLGSNISWWQTILYSVHFTVLNIYQSFQTWIFLEHTNLTYSWYVSDTLLMTDYRNRTLLPSMPLQALHYMAPEPPWRLPSWSRISPPTFWPQYSLFSNRLFLKSATCTREPEICHRVYNTI